MSTDTTPIDVREMRRRIQAAARGPGWIGGERSELSAGAPLIHAVLRVAEREGWSGEDTMTALAYHMLVQYERMHQVLINDASMRPSAPLVVPAAKG